MPRIPVAMTRNTAYLRNRPLRKGHIGRAVDAAGGNTLCAQKLIDYLGLDISVERLRLHIGQWRNKGYVPLEYCAALVAASGGVFRPEWIRHAWDRERLTLKA